MLKLKDNGFLVSSCISIANSDQKPSALIKINIRFSVLLDSVFDGTILTSASTYDYLSSFRLNQFRLPNQRPGPLGAWA